MKTPDTTDPISLKLGEGRSLSLIFDRELMPPGLDLAAKFGPAVSHRHLPLELVGTLSPFPECAICCFVEGSEAGVDLVRRCEWEAIDLANGAYAVEWHPGESGGGLLAIRGGDRFGALAGLVDVVKRCRLAGDDLVYSGGERVETPAFPLRFYWTWDHSTNWVLDDPGNQTNGCNNPYLKKPETFLEDYRRLIDHAVASRFNAVMISGFFREAHGGEVSAYEIARYGADRGVAVLPGVGTHSYNGIYYEGDHPAHLHTFTREHPECRMVDRHGKTGGNLGPHHDGSKEYVRRSLEWMMKAFPVGGVYLENGDYMVDHSEMAKKARQQIPSGEEDFLKDQYAAYLCALEVLDRVCPEAWNVYVTYCGFDMNGAERLDRGLGKELPYFATRMPESAVCMWTLSGMLRKQPVKLREWMECPRPDGVYENPTWPRGIRPPTPRSAGFMHQGSQWSPVPRTALALSTYAEGCLRSHESGLEGISIHGEATSRTMTWKLNYLAMRHWTYHPESTLREFARVELAPELGSLEEAYDFIEALCLLDEGRHGEARAIADRYIGSGYSWVRSKERTMAGLEPQRMWMEMKWWGCHPDSAVNTPPHLCDIV